MQATASKEHFKEEFVDPVCGMTVDPARAAGTSERDGVRYYFCATGCKQKFDAAAAAPVQLTAIRKSSASAPGHGHADAHTVDAEEAQARSYRTMMRKFWFAAAVGLPLLLLMFAEFVPSWHHALMPHHRIIGVVSAVV